MEEITMTTALAAIAAGASLAALIISAKAARDAKRSDFWSSLHSTALAHIVKAQALALKAAQAQVQALRDRMAEEERYGDAKALDDLDKEMRDLLG